jgi:hypothetical protein
MPSPLPITVLIPTRNSAAFVPPHLDSLRPWIALAEEVIVVDSESKDGTVDLIRKGLSHPRLRFLAHPPGLYQSWNFGIQNAAARYIYVSTVGDAITGAGMEHLFDTAETRRADVVISKPDFVNEQGQPRPDSHWPIDEILGWLKITEPRLLTTTEQFLFAVTNTWGAILGSSASNLYRADCLKARPFPTEFGTSGDGGWGIKNVFDVKIAVTPRRFSTFRHHEKTYSLAPYQVESLALKLFRLALDVIEEQGPRHPAVADVLREARWPELAPALNITFVEQERLEKCRRTGRPWFLQPSAWQARSTREKAKIRIRELTAAIIAQASNSR